MKRLGIPVVYYIGPQLWAWRAWRMRDDAAADVSKVLVIFPFEEALYRRRRRAGGVRRPPARRDGRGRGGRTSTRQTFCGTSSGCRPDRADRGAAARQPAERAGAARAGARRQPARCSRPRVPERAVRGGAGAAPAGRRCSMPLRQAAARLRPAAGRSVRDRTDAVLAGTDVAITASGTATVQCAIHGRPMVVIYKLSRADATRWAKPFVRVDTLRDAEPGGGRAASCRS